MNRVLAHTGAKYPIVQAPMGWIARTQLASAVSRAGGLGIMLDDIVAALYALVLLLIGEGAFGVRP